MPYSCSFRKFSIGIEQTKRYIAGDFHAVEHVGPIGFLVIATPVRLKAVLFRFAVPAKATIWCQGNHLQSVLARQSADSDQVLNTLLRPLIRRGPKNNDGAFTGP